MACYIASYPPDQVVLGDYVAALEELAGYPLGRSRACRNEFERFNDYDQVIARILINIMGRCRRNPLP